MYFIYTNEWRGKCRSFTGKNLFPSQQKEIPGIYGWHKNFSFTSHGTNGVFVAGLQFSLGAFGWQTGIQIPG